MTIKLLKMFDRFIPTIIGTILVLHGSILCAKAALSDKKKHDLHIYPIQSKKFFVEMSAIYGTLADGGTNLSPFAEIIQTPNEVNGNAKNYVTKLGVNWGYQATLGYFLTDNHRYALMTNFLALDNRRTVNARITDGDLSYLYNQLTQLGNARDPENYGFSIFNAQPSQASSTASIQYQRLNMHLEEPWDDLEDTAKIFDFHKTKGIMAVYLSKAVTGDYTGNVYIGTQGGFVENTPGRDSLIYAANSFGAGPQLGILANGRVTERLKVHVTAEAAILAGYYNAHYRENANTQDPITLGNNTSTSFTNSNTHPSSSWTPVFFDVQMLLEAQLWESKKNHCHLNGSGGLGGEYILPTFTNNGITEILGTPLAKFNNNLSVSYVIIRLSFNSD